MDTVLYMKDPYTKSFNSEVKEVQGDTVILNETAFYPTGGGQPTDMGRLVKEGGEEFNVISVKKQAGQILHQLDKEGLQPGDKVHGTIDWDRRYKLMRYHTAAHVVSAVIHKETGALITGNQLELEKARIDFNTESFNKEDIQKYEEKANQIIKAGHEVKINFLPREEAEKVPTLVKLAKSLPESLKIIRTIEIQDIDLQACGGCHLKNTSEIGSIKITETKNKGANNRRLYFKIC